MGRPNQAKKSVPNPATARGDRPTNSNPVSSPENRNDWEQGTLENLEATAQLGINQADTAIEETSDRISSDAGKALGAGLKQKLVLETRKKTALEAVKAVKGFVENDAPALLAGMEAKYAEKYSLRPSSVASLEAGDINFSSTDEVVSSERNITEESSIENLLDF